MKQKAKIAWLQEGDTNSAYFHRSVKAQASRRRIDCVMGPDNVLYEGNLVPNIFVQHYMNFIGEESEVNPLILEGLFVKRLGQEKADNMVRSVSDEEIRNAMFSIDNDKAPGQMGIHHYFLRRLGIFLVVRSVRL